MFSDNQTTRPARKLNLVLSLIRSLYVYMVNVCMYVWFYHSLHVAFKRFLTMFIQTLECFTRSLGLRGQSFIHAPVSGEKKRNSTFIYKQFLGLERQLHVFY